MVKPTALQFLHTYTIAPTPATVRYKATKLGEEEVQGSRVRVVCYRRVRKDGSFWKGQQVKRSSTDEVRERIRDSEQ